MKKDFSYRNVTMLDLKAEYALFRDRVREVVDDVLESQHFIGGPAIAELENAICTKYGVAHAVAISSGTDALLCALMGLEIEPGDEIILPAFTFFATAGTVHRLQARPVFADINPRTFNLDAKSIERAITPKTKAIIPVHLYGQCAEMDSINAVARWHNIPVVEDAAQAIGATYKGKFAGRLGRIACLSFYPTKNLGGFGEGGMILTDDEPLAALCRQLRTHGESQRYYHDRVGGNFRLDTMKAAILLVKLEKLDEFTRRRRANAAIYGELFKAANVAKSVTSPFVAPGNEHVFHQYSILCERRDELAAHLRNRGVSTGVYYPVPLHLQKCFGDLGYGPCSLPVTEQTCQRILSIPCHPMLSRDDIEYVVQSIQEFYAK